MCYENILAITDESKEELQFDNKKLVTYQGPIKALRLEQFRNERSVTLQNPDQDGQKGNTS